MPMVQTKQLFGLKNMIGTRVQVQMKIHVGEDLLLKPQASGVMQNTMEIKVLTQTICYIQKKEDKDIARK